MSDISHYSILYGRVECPPIETHLLLNHSDEQVIAKDAKLYHDKALLEKSYGCKIKMPALHTKKINRLHVWNVELIY